MKTVRDLAIGDVIKSPLPEDKPKAIPRRVVHLVPRTGVFRVFTVEKNNPHAQAIWELSSDLEVITAN